MDGQSSCCLIAFDFALTVYAVAWQQLFKKMAQSGAPAARASLESGAFTFHYIIDNDVCYLTLVEKSYPKKLAYQYLEELQREFFSLYGREIEQARRPYAFIKFGGSDTECHVKPTQGLPMKLANVLCQGCNLDI